MLSCLWDGVYKRSLAANKNKIAHVVAAVSFLSDYLSGPLLYHICPTPYNRKLNVLNGLLNKIFPFFLNHIYYISYISRKYVNLYLSDLSQE